MNNTHYINNKDNLFKEAIVKYLKGLKSYDGSLHKGFSREQLDVSKCRNLLENDANKESAAEQFLIGAKLNKFGFLNVFAKIDRFDLFKLEFESMDDVNFTSNFDARGDTPIHAAAIGGSIDTLNYLVNKMGCDVIYTINESGRSILFRAAKHNKLAFFEKAYEIGGEKLYEIEGKSDKTLFHFFLEHSNEPDLIEKLIKIIGKEKIEQIASKDIKSFKDFCQNESYKFANRVLKKYNIFDNGKSLCQEYSNIENLDDILEIHRQDSAHQQEILGALDYSSSI